MDARTDVRLELNRDVDQSVAVEVAKDRLLNRFAKRILTRHVFNGAGRRNGSRIESVLADEDRVRIAVAVDILNIDRDVLRRRNDKVGRRKRIVVSARRVAVIKHILTAVDREDFGIGIAPDVADRRRARRVEPQAVAINPLSDRLRVDAAFRRGRRFNRNESARAVCHCADDEKTVVIDDPVEGQRRTVPAQVVP